MRHHNSVFHALLKHLPRHRFDQVVKRHGGDKGVRRLPCWSQFVAMIYAQLSGARSLRDVEASLASHSAHAYHLGLNQVRRSTLSDANALRPCAVYEEVFGLLLEQASSHLARRCRKASQVLRLIDATPVGLNAGSVSWARFSSHYIAAKVHVVYDPHADIPVFFEVTPARKNDITVAKTMPLEAGATYVFDKAYYDFSWWARMHELGCRFVTRLKANSPVRPVETIPITQEGIVRDQLVRLNERMMSSRKNPYQGVLREVVVQIDADRQITLLSNDLDASAQDIAELYKQRWQIELFFKWGKQNLKIKRFLGTSLNAVKIQIAIALIVYLLVRLTHQAIPNAITTSRFLRLVCENLMHRKSIPELLRPPPDKHNNKPKTPQLEMAL